MIAPVPLTTISFVFDDLTVCDERSFIQLLVDQWGLHTVYIPCDDAWPFKEMERWPHNPNFPEANSYRLLKERAYRRASKEGLRVLMSGALGDELYCGEEDWLFDLIADGRLQEAAQELWRQIYYTDLRRTLESVYVRRVARRLVNLVPGGRRLKRAPRPPVWLRREAADRLYHREDWLDPAFELKSNLLGIGVSQDSSHEIINAGRHALELRHPYRDLRLVEYVLSLQRISYTTWVITNTSCGWRCRASCRDRFFPARSQLLYRRFLCAARNWKNRNCSVSFVTLPRLGVITSARTG